GFTDNQLNGNIAGVKWRSKSSNLQRAYGFKYDPVNRLTKADYSQGTSWLNTESDFSTTYGYDANGNILNLMRKGVVAGTIATIDQLTYNYGSGLNAPGTGNKLIAVADAAGDLGQGDFVDGNTSSTDYGYDLNGNMNSDANKSITSISYNHLNLPTTVTFTGSRSISYTYDAVGIKLKKTVNNNGTVTTTDYAGGFIYENNALQFFAHDEGRVRKSDGSLVYDYYIKDHLGNTRMTLTEDTDVTIYRATMETDVVPSTGIDLGDYEGELFLNLPSSRDDGATSASVNTTNEVGIDNDETARLNGADASRRIGPAKLLAVSPGDQINVSVNSYHTGFTGTQSPESQVNIINALASAFGGSASSALGTESRSIYEFFNTNAALAYVGSNGSSSKPRAYLNVLLFDQDFNPVSGQSGFLQTDQASGYKTLNISKSIGQGGYVYVYLSNEGQTGFDVYFDDLSITHTKGAILQEDHYYPFGANISALSSTAPLSKPNQFKFNRGTELNSDFDFNIYEATYRGYDANLGRFMQVDPLADFFTDWTPYQFGYNDPIYWNDPMGLANQSGDSTWVSSSSLIQYMWDNTPEDGSASFEIVGYNPYGDEVGRTSTAQGVDIYHEGEYAVSIRSKSRSSGFVEQPSEPNIINFSRSKAALGSGGLIYGVGENVIYNGSTWLGKNGKFNSVSWGGNQWTGGRSAALTASKTWKIAGRGVFFVGAGISFYEGVVAYQSGDNAALAKAGVDLFFGAVGTFGGPIGLGISGVYFLVDSTVGWDNAFEAVNELDKTHQRVTGKSLYSRSGIY
ncbi:MAG: hypothetical protein COW40_08260, partial [Cytophagales bacterium CG17_big_fil_post_rev_8_21_14_2_50_40_13]